MIPILAHDLTFDRKDCRGSVRLGEDFPNDSADQINVATARCHDLTLITADERIRNWGNVRVV